MGKHQPIVSSTEAFAQALEEAQNTRYFLKLYIAGYTARSQAAIINTRKVSEERLKGRYQLEVIDVYQKKDLTKEKQIIATPTLIKSLPLPQRRVIGDLSNTERILVGLDLINAE